MTYTWYIDIFRPDSTPTKLKEILTSQAVSAADLEAQWQQEEEEKKRAEEKKKEEEDRARQEEEERIVSPAVIKRSDMFLFQIFYPLIIKVCFIL